MAPNEQPTLPAEGSYTDLEQLFIEEQPKRLWPENQNSNAGALRRVITDPLQRAADLLSELALERFVETSTGYLSRWEEEVGISKNPVDRTIEERRALILGRLKKGYFTRTRREEIVAQHVVVTFGAATEITAAGIPITPDGITLFSGITSVDNVYQIIENILSFSYTVEILNTATVDNDSLLRELRRVTPAHINFTVNYVSSLSGEEDAYGAGAYGSGAYGQ